MPIFKRVLGLSVADKGLLVETLVLLALARAAVLTLPFRWVACALGRPDASLLGLDASEVDPVGAARIRRIGLMVRRVSENVPWTSKCLDQALAARILLARRGITATVFFGVKNDDRGELEAHAWLRSGTLFVTGGSNHAQFTAINAFTNEGAP